MPRSVRPAAERRAQHHRRGERQEEEQVVPHRELRPDHEMNRNEQEHHDRRGDRRSDATASRDGRADEPRAQRRNQSQNEATDHHRESEGHGGFHLRVAGQRGAEDPVADGGDSGPGDDSGDDGKDGSQHRGPPFEDREANQYVICSDVRKVVSRLSLRMLSSPMVISPPPDSTVWKNSSPFPGMPSGSTSMNRAITSTSSSAGSAE